ncbi:hypothetical protein HanRHA438_Chr01g0044701 [Helianthus annuus]|nr:hypothetical protein HanRHA438_Chr01g0044701 [Helianthus annuus]
MATINLLNLLLKETHPLSLILLKHTPISNTHSTFMFTKLHHLPPRNNHHLLPPIASINLRHSTVHHPAKPSSSATINRCRINHCYDV